jgi:hypothetical protein
MGGARPNKKWNYVPVCPWCGDEVDDTPNEMYFDRGQAKTDCGGCGKPVVVTRDITVNYKTVKAEAR